MSRFDVREMLAETFGDPWIITHWEKYYIVLRDININNNHTSVLYFLENGICGLILSLEKSLLFSNMSVSYLSKHKDIYLKRQDDEDLYLELLGWDERKEEIVVLEESFLEEEFDSDVKKFVMAQFELFMRITR